MGGRATPGGGPLRGSWAGPGRRDARMVHSAVRCPVRPAIGPEVPGLWAAPATQLGQMYVFSPFAALERATDMLWAHLWPSSPPPSAPLPSRLPPRLIPTPPPPPTPVPPRPP